MPQRKQEFFNGGYYHIYNRGVNRLPIFLNDADYIACLTLVKKNMARYGLAIIAYCLMPNHYHFLVRQKSEVGVSKFVSATFNSYAQKFNARHKRSGTLFESRFKHVLVDSDEYLRHLCAYIHCNPVKAGLVDRVDGWAYSNFPEWVGLREGTLFDRQFVYDFYPDRAVYWAFVRAYLDGDKGPDGFGRMLFD